MPTTTVPEIQVVNGVAEGEGDGPAPPEGDAPPGDPFKTTPVIRGQLMGYPVQYWSPKTAQEELDETEAAIEAELLVDGGDEDDIILLLERQCVGASLDHLVPEDLSRPDVTLRVPKGQRRPKHVGRPSSLHITPGYLSTPVGEGEGLEGAVGEDRSASLPPSTKQGLKERFLGKRKRKIPWWLVWLVRKRRKAAKKGKAEGEEEEPKVQGSTSPVFYPEGSGKARLATPEQFEHPDGTPHAEAKIKAKIEAPDLHIAAGVEPTKIPLSKGRSLDTTLSPGKVSPELPPLDRMVSAPTGKADIELSPLKRSHETPDLAGAVAGDILVQPPSDDAIRKDAAKLQTDLPDDEEIQQVDAPDTNMGLKIGFPQIHIKGPRFSFGTKKPKAEAKAKAKAEATPLELDVRGPTVEGELPRAKGDVEVDGEMPDDRPTWQISGPKIQMPKLRVKGKGKAEGKIKPRPPSLEFPDRPIPYADGEIEVDLPETDDLTPPEVPQIQGGVVVEGDIRPPAIRGEVDGTLPEIDGEGRVVVQPPRVEGPDVRPEDVHIEGKPWQLPDFDLKGPKIRMPEVRLKGPQIKRPRVEGEVDTPEGRLPGPEAEVQVRPPGAEGPGVSGDVEGPDVEGKVKPPKGAFWEPPEFGLKGPKIKMPEIHIKGPKLKGKGPKVEGELGPPDADVEPPKGRLPPAEAEVEVRPPGLDGTISGDLDGPEVKGRTPKGQWDLPEFDLKGPKIKMPEMHIKRPKVKGKLPKGEAEGPELEGDLPTGEAAGPDVEPPSGDVDIEGKKPKAGFKLPDWELKGPKVRLPDWDLKGPRIKGKGPKVEGEVDLEGPEGELPPAEGEVEIRPAGEGPNGEIPGDLQAPEGKVKYPKGPSWDLPDWELKGPKIKMPEIHLKGTKIKGKKPKVEGEVEGPEIEGELPSGKIEGPEVEPPSGEVDVDGKKPKAGFELPDWELKGPKIKLPDWDLKGPKIKGKGPKGEIDLEGPEGELPPAEGEVEIRPPGVEGPNGRISGDIEGPEGKVKGRSWELPDWELKGPKIKMPEIHLKGPKFKGKKPKAEGELEADFEGPEVEGELPSGKIELPEGKVEGEVTPPGVEGDLKVKGDRKSWELPEFHLKGPKIKMPKFKGKKPKVEGELEGPEIEGELPSGKIEGPEVEPPSGEVDIDGKKPKGGFELPDWELKGPKIKLPDWDLKAPKFKGKGPKVEGELEADFEGPEIEGEIPRGKVDIEGPEVEVPSGKVDIDVEGPEGELDIDGKKPKGGFKLPDWELKGPKVKLPDWELKGPKIKGKKPTVEGEIDLEGPEGELPPAEGEVEIRPPGVEGPDGKISGEIEGPEGKVKGPSWELPDWELKGPKIKMPEIHLKGPKFKGKKPKVSGEVDVEGPEFEGDLPSGKVEGPDVDVDVPKGEIEGELPSGKIKGKGDRKSWGLPDIDIKGPKVKFPSLSRKKGKGKIEGEIEGDLEGPDVEPPSGKVEIEGPSGDLDIKGKKPKGGFKLPDWELKGPKVKLPDWELKGPKVKGKRPTVEGEIDAELEGPEVEIPGAEAEVELPEGEIQPPEGGKRSSWQLPEFHLKGPKVKMPEIDIKGPKFKGRKPKAGGELDVDIEGPEIEGPEVEGELPSGKIELPEGKVEGEVTPPGVEGDLKVKGDRKSWELPEFHLKGPKIKMPKFKGKKPKVEGELEGPEIEGELPSGKIEGPEVEPPSGEVDIDGKKPKGGFELPDWELKGPKIKLPDWDLKGPKFKGKGPKVEGELEADFEGPEIEGEIPRGKVDIEGPEVEVPSGKVDIDVEGPEGELDIDGKKPKGGFKLPDWELKGPKLSLPDWDLTGKKPKVEGQVEVEGELPHGDIPSAEIEVQGPEVTPGDVKVQVEGDLPEADLKGTGDRKSWQLPEFDFKGPKVKFPSLPRKKGKVKAKADLPSGEADISGPDVPSGELEVKGDLPEADIKGKGDRRSWQLPDVELKGPKIKFPSLPRKKGKIEGEAEVEIPSGEVPTVKPVLPPPEAEVKLPTGGADISDKEKRSSWRVPEFDLGSPHIEMTEYHVKVPKITWKSPKAAGHIDVESQVPKGDVSFEGPKVEGDIRPPEVEGDVKVTGPDADLRGKGKGPSFGFELPEFELKGPQIEMPKLDIARPRVEGKADVDLEGPTVDVELPTVPSAEADVSVEGEAEVKPLDIQLPKFLLQSEEVPSADVPSGKVEVKGEVDQPEGEWSLPGLDFKGPGITMPDIELKGPKLGFGEAGVEGEVKGPSVEGKAADIQVEAPSVDVDIPKVQAELEEIEAKVRQIKADAGQVELEGPKVEVGGDKKRRSLELKMPSVKMPSFKVKGKGKTPKAAVEVEPPDVELKGGAEAELPAEEKRASLKRRSLEIKMPSVKMPSFKAKAAAPDASVDITPPEAEVDSKVEVPKEDKRSSLKRLSLEIKMPSISMPKFSAKGKTEVEVQPPELDVSGPEVEVQPPSVEGELEAEAAPPPLPEKKKKKKKKQKQKKPPLPAKEKEKEKRKSLDDRFRSMWGKMTGGGTAEVELPTVEMPTFAMDFGAGAPMPEGELASEAEEMKLEPPSLEEVRRIDIPKLTPRSERKLEAGVQLREPKVEPSSSRDSASSVEELRREDLPQPIAVVESVITIELTEDDIAKGEDQVREKIAASIQDAQMKAMRELLPHAEAHAKVQKPAAVVELGDQVQVSKLTPGEKKVKIKSKLPSFKSKIPLLRSSKKAKAAGAEAAAEAAAPKAEVKRELFPGEEEESWAPVYGQQFHFETQETITIEGDAEFSTTSPAKKEIKKRHSWKLKSSKKKEGDTEEGAEPVTWSEAMGRAEYAELLDVFPRSVVVEIEPESATQEAAVEAESAEGAAAEQVEVKKRSKIFSLTSKKSRKTEQRKSLEEVESSHRPFRELEEGRALQMTFGPPPTTEAKEEKKKKKKKGKDEKELEETGEVPLQAEAAAAEEQFLVTRSAPSSPLIDRQADLREAKAEGQLSFTPPRGKRPTSEERPPRNLGLKPLKPARRSRSLPPTTQRSAPGRGRGRGRGGVRPGPRQARPRGRGRGMPRPGPGQPLQQQQQQRPPQQQPPQGGPLHYL